MQIKIRRATTTSRFSQTQIKRIEELASNVSIDKVAEQFDMEEETFCGMLKSQKSALKAYRKGRTIRALKSAKTLRERTEAGNTEAIIFFSKLYGLWSDKPEYETTDKAPSLPIIKITINNRPLKLRNS